MMLSFYVTFLLISSLFTIIFCGNIEHTVLRGVPTSLHSKYVPSKNFSCLDGSSTIPFEFVNDDYCDCRDGSDEPGTSACPNGQFFCENKGYIGTLIPSHLVGDGVCDCCDGSDEYETTIVCNNTCFELAQKTKAEREAKQALHEAGVIKKKEIIATSVVSKATRQTRLIELEQDLRKLEYELKGKEELKQQAEIPENEAKGKHQKLWEEQRAVREAIARDNQMREMFADLDTNNDSLVSIEELQKHTELDTDHENEFTAEEVRSILGADSVNFDEFNVTVFEQISNSYQKLPQISIETPVNQDDSAATTEAHLKQEEEEEEESAAATEGDYEEDLSHHEASTHVATSLDHGKHIHDDTVPEYDDETKRLIETADHARNEYNEVERKVHDIKRQIDDLKRQSDVDVGIHGEYSAFIDQCYDYEEREYTYRICMFKDAKQIPKGGGSEVTIGYWDSWCGPTDNKYLRMKYANGATCWNGPARSLTVTFRCGIEHKTVDVREPTRCEYAMLFETPSACDETIAIASVHPDHEEF
ncbi:unnamed protein product [Rotaria sordida]|uniref:Glucosidase 2 subunit beta n=1 Tax=Rotaria sordida TaxID=392033 RepID=A0A818KSV3_9BILA|nr:unnamed protein product [Rotaria sordida]CAF3555920.1 unnamed protein product [Rotaria sordida]